MAHRLTDEQRRDWERTLRDYMSMMSERALAASWMDGLTERLIEACEQVQRTGKQANIWSLTLTPAESEVLLFMVDKLGYWMDMEGPYQPPLDTKPSRNE